MDGDLPSVFALSQMPFSCLTSLCGDLHKRVSRETFVEALDYHTSW